MDFDFISNFTIRLMSLALDYGVETRVDTSLGYHGSSALRHVNANALKSRILITL